MALNVAPHVHDAYDGMEDFGDQNQDYRLNKRLLEVLPLVDLLVVLVLLQCVDEADELLTQYRGHYGIDSVYQNKFVTPPAFTNNTP